MYRSREPDCAIPLSSIDDLEMAVVADSEKRIAHELVSGSQ